VKTSKFYCRRERYSLANEQDDWNLQEFRLKERKTGQRLASSKEFSERLSEIDVHTAGCRHYGGKAGWHPN